MKKQRREEDDNGKETVHMEVSNLKKKEHNLRYILIYIKNN